MRIRLACKFTFFRSHASPFPRFFVTSSLLLPPRCPPSPSSRCLIVQCVPGSARGKLELRFALRQVPSPSVGVDPLAGFACILLTRMATTVRRVGEGRFFFISPHCLLFPLFYYAWRCAQSLRAIAQEGCWRCVNPFRTMPLRYRNKGCYPPRKPRYPPPSAASLRRNGGLGRGGSFSFSPPCLLFPLFYFAWRCAQPLRASAQEGYWHFVCRISWTHRPFGEASNDAGAGNERDVGATAENTGATARKRETFRTALRVRLREASTPRVVAPCRRRAREEAERHGRERDKCRAKT